MNALLKTFLSSIGAIVLALVVGAIFIVVFGEDPFEAYKAMFTGAFGDRRGIAETLVSATPLILGGLAFSIAARAGMFNIGIEGQLMMGGLASGVVSAYDLGLPAVAFLPLALLTAAIAGGIWGALPGVLKAKAGAHEVISTIMLNYLAYRANTYLINEADWLPVNPQLQATDKAQAAARLPNILSGTRLHAGIILAVIAAFVLYFVLFRTTFGYRIRTVGISRGAADYAGIKWGPTIVMAMFVSGMMSGFAGAGESLGLQGRHFAGPPGYGFTAIAVGLVGRNHPLGVLLSGLMFGALRSGANEMQNQVGTSKELVQILQGLVILSVSAFASFGRFQAWRAQRATAKRSTQGPAAPLATGSGTTS
jgi:simple sugar transport system permease protein